MRRLHYSFIGGDIVEIDYKSIADAEIAYPRGTLQDFEDAVYQAVAKFEKNEMFNLVNGKTLTMSHYQQLLLILFHQVYNSAASFALAGVNLSFDRQPARDYLFKHAEEEKDHWQWVIGDLRATNYSGPDPRQLFPYLTAQSYFSYAFFLANKFPIGRLGMAAVLEGIGGQFGTPYGKKLIELLNLKKEQANFFLMHGELDGGHSQEVMEMIQRCKPSPYEWAHLAYVASTTGMLYTAMYSEAAR